MQELRYLGHKSPRLLTPSIEMAETWDMLAEQRQSDKLAETWALAEAISNSRNLGL
jgi:hypothetical protein